MRCPVDASPLREHRYDDEVVAACQQCQGLWLRVTDLRDAAMRDGLAALVRQTGDGGVLGARPSAPATRHCPGCGLPLASRTVGGVEIDCCAGCRGIWLDAGERPAIAAWHHRRALAPASSSGPVTHVADVAVDGLLEAGATAVYEKVEGLGTAVVEFMGECLAGLFDGLSP